MGFFSSIGDALGGAIGGIVGGVTSLFGNKQTNDANASLNAQQMAFAREQLEYQKELAKNQIQWRVEDAQKAGLHPMAALGLQSSSFSPVSSSFTPMQADDYSWIGDIGQSVGYAAMKAKDKNQQKQALALAEKQSALSLRNMELQNQSLELENEYQRFKLQQAVVGGTSQALRSAGSASVSGLPKASYAIEGQPESRYMDTPIPEHGFLRDSRGKIVDIIPSDDWKQRVEDTLFVEWLPWLSSVVKGGKAKLLGSSFDGYYWHPETEEYLPYPPKKKSKPSYRSSYDAFDPFYSLRR